MAHRDQQLDTSGRARRSAPKKGGGLVLTHLRAGRHADPGELAAEAAGAFGGPVTAARDLDAYRA